MIEDIRIVEYIDEDPMKCQWRIMIKIDGNWLEPERLRFFDKNKFDKAIRNG